MHHTVWTTREGAPSHIRTITQRSDGYLLVTSPDGLFQFDGVRFQPVIVPSGKKSISDGLDFVRELPSGDIVTSSRMGNIAILNNGEVTNYDETSGLPGASVMDIVSDRKGHLWVATYAGLYVLRSDHWYPFGRELGFDKSNSLAVFVDKAGILWVSDGKSVSFLDSGSNTFRRAPHTQPGIVSIAEDDQRRIWGLDEFGALKELDRVEPDVLVAFQKHQKTRARSLYFDREGDCWLLGDETGLQHVKTLRGDIAAKGAVLETLRASDGGVSSDTTGDFLEDREGNFWITTAKGLDRYRRNAFTALDFPERSKGEGKGLLPDDGSGLYLSPWTGPVQHLTTISRPLTGKNIPHDISCMYRDPQGASWFGGPQGLWRKDDKTFTFIPLPTPDGRSDDVQALASDGHGGVWVSFVGEGVYQWSNRKWVPFGNSPDLPRVSAITELATAEGTVWFGYTRNRIATLDGDRLQLFSSSNGLAVGNVMALYQRGTIWVAGDDGLQYYDHGHFRSIVAAGEISLRKISGIIQTSTGDLWLNQDSGVVLISVNEVEKAKHLPSYAVKIRHFDARDGLTGSYEGFRPLPTAVQAGNGDLWFVQDEGIAKIDPAHVLSNQVPPPVEIESLTVDGKLFAKSNNLTLPSKPDSVRFDYTALSLTMPEKLSFRYKLDGIDDVWQEADHRRQAFYTRLPPGTFHFHVIASNNDGVWNQTGSEITFKIPPTMTQTIWFKAVCVLATIVSLCLVVLWRLHFVTETVKVALSERMFERERIARELHDTLLQGLQGLLLRFETATRRIPGGEPARGMMESALDRADEVLIEARNRVKDLRAEGMVVQDLASAFEAIGNTMAVDQAVNFEVSVSGTPRALHLIVKDEAYWIGREALSNSFSHAQARNIRAMISFEQRALILKWTDDGRGIEKKLLESGREGHWGLKGMRERANEISASIDILSDPGKGTRVELRIPATAAYQASGLRGWRQRIKRFI